jgi:hypothetical protein
VSENSDTLTVPPTSACMNAMTSRGIRVDLIFAALPFEREMIDRAGRKPFRDRFIPVASVEDLILLKSVSLRAKDRIVAKTGRDRVLKKGDPQAQPQDARTVQPAKVSRPAHRGRRDHRAAVR